MWDDASGAYADTGKPSRGEKGAIGAAGADGNDGRDGTDGITPTIGENGNWYLGATDTGKPSRGKDGATGATGATGEKGADGKSAYAYAVDGDYTGTEAEFAAKLAEEIPDALPNPNALTFTGAVTGSYDGSAPLSVNIPQGGGGGSVETYTGEYELIVDHTVTAEEASASSFTFTKDAYPLINGQKLLVVQISKPAPVSTPWFELIAGSTTVCKADNGTFQYFRGLSIVFYNRWLSSNASITNKQLTTSLTPSVVLRSDYGPSYLSKPYQHYTSIKLSSYMAFLEEGTVIKIYGGK